MRALGIFTLAITLNFWGAFAGWCLWGWFIVPLGAPSISYGWAYGLSMVVDWFEWSCVPIKIKESDENHPLRMFARAIGYATILAIGAVTHVIVGSHP